MVGRGRWEWRASRDNYILGYRAPDNRALDDLAIVLYDDAALKKFVRTMTHVFNSRTQREAVFKLYKYGFRVRNNRLNLDLVRDKRLIALLSLTVNP